MVSFELGVDLGLDVVDLGRLDDEVAGVEVGDDERVGGRELVVAPELRRAYNFDFLAAFPRPQTRFLGHVFSVSIISLALA